MTRTKALVAVVAVSLVAVLLASVVGGTAQEGMAKRQSFGGGSAAVVAPPGVIDVAWVLDGSDSSKVASVTVGFATALVAVNSVKPIVCVQVTEDGSPPPILANGCNPTAVGAVVSVSLTSPVSAEPITGVSVTVIQPVVGVAAPTGVQVTEVAWTLLPADTTKVEKVDVTLDVPTGTGVLKAHLTLKDTTGDVLQRVTGLPVAGTGTTRSVTWDLTAEGDPLLVGPVPAEAITRFEIQVTPG